MTQADWPCNDDVVNDRRRCYNDACNNTSLWRHSQQQQQPLQVACCRDRDVACLLNYAGVAAIYYSMAHCWCILSPMRLWRRLGLGPSPKHSRPWRLLRFVTAPTNHGNAVQNTTVKMYAQILIDK